ncbi:MAG: glycosyltransferase family 39 protein [Pyrinomonadaceae bacterium]|nr:glycosyltransferase family 39 protein [Pyrinomonadaceae bacterium]
MENGTAKLSLWQEPIFIAFLIAALKFAVYVAAGSGYGYFRDELYFLACADNLAWGYPDHAPLSVFLTWLSRSVFGDSIYAIHLFPAVAGSLKIILTGLIVRELGGRHIAMLLACISVLVAPIYLGIDLMLSMNAYEPIFWMGCVIAYIRAVNTGDSRYWLLFGVIAGLGLMNKHSMVFFGAAMVLGLLVTKDRRMFADRNIWIGGLIAFLIFLPNLIWQYQNDWATLELLRNVQATGKNVVLSPPQFIWEQVFILLPFTAPVWLAGIWYFLANKEGRRFRALGIAYLVTLALMTILKAKNYYLVPVYPMLFAAGGVFWENIFSRIRIGRFAAWAYAAILVALGGVMLPLVVPVLPVEKLIAYQSAIGITPPKTEVGHVGPLPQHFGDRFGWEEMTAKTADVYNSLTPDEREKAAIYTSNYGEAGAIDLFGRQYGLPRAISGHQSYFMWGPRGHDGSIMIVLGEEREELEEICNTVEVRDRVGHPYAMAEEHFDILLCRGLKAPLAEFWSKTKHWN